MRVSAAIATLMAFVALPPAERARAGVLLSPGLAWTSFAFRPLAEEDPAPNYFALAPSMTLGYSIRQNFDLSAFINYAPGTRGGATVGKEHASLQFYGGQIGWRLEDALFFALRGGGGEYLLVSRDPESEFEAEGKWVGPSGGFVFGSIYRINKRHYWQISLEINHYVLKRTQDSEALGKRRLDEFRLAVSYTYNSFINSRIFDSLFENVL